MAVIERPNPISSKRDSRTGVFVVETFSAPSAAAGRKIASSRGTTGQARAEYGRTLGVDVQEFGGYILSKRLSRSTRQKRKE